MKITRSIETIAPEWFLDVAKGFKANVELKEWEKQGKPVPAPHRVKQLVIESYQKAFGIHIFIETGTFMGDMVYAVRKYFKVIYSIELGSDLWQAAVERFKKKTHITILQGDSGKVLIDLVPQIKEKAIFWLDGHYSSGVTAKGDKNCPIFEELSAIFDSKINHILLIDDARCFNGSCDYPTIEELSAFILSKRSQSVIEVKDDIIRVIPG